jgi:phosphoenolpyruvate synthase/pyruvate phosphate dikinase
MTTGIRSGTIRRLADVRIPDVAEVGGKAANLGELLAAGVRVPDGVVLTAGAADLSPADRESLLRDALSALGTGPFAVRSSGISEDGLEHSYAGMYESVLDVPPDELPAAIDRVLASASGARLADYRLDGSRSIAVIVQQMVTPAAAGVVLTADPINGDRSTCVVTAVRGLAERLVSGAAIGDEWVVRDRVATSRRQPEHAIDRAQAMRIGARLDESQLPAARHRTSNGRSTPRGRSGSCRPDR